MVRKFCFEIMDVFARQYSKLMITRLVKPVTENSANIERFQLKGTSLLFTVPWRFFTLKVALMHYSLSLMNTRTLINNLFGLTIN